MIKAILIFIFKFKNYSYPVKHPYQIWMIAFCSVLIYLVPLVIWRLRDQRGCFQLRENHGLSQSQRLFLLVRILQPGQYGCFRILHAVQRYLFCQEWFLQVKFFSCDTLHWATIRSRQGHHFEVQAERQRFEDDRDHDHVFHQFRQIWVGKFTSILFFLIFVISSYLSNCIYDIFERIVCFPDF